MLLRGMFSEPEDTAVAILPDMFSLDSLWDVVKSPEEIPSPSITLAQIPNAVRSMLHRQNQAQKSQCPKSL